MRIAQFARKYDLGTQEIISFLQESSTEAKPLHPNAKLSEDAQHLIADAFSLDLLQNQDEQLEPSSLGPIDEPKVAEEVSEVVEAEAEVDEHAASNEAIAQENPSERNEVEERAELVQQQDELLHDSTTEQLTEQEVEPAKENATEPVQAELVQADSNETEALEEQAHMEGESEAVELVAPHGDLEPKSSGASIGAGLTGESTDDVDNLSNDQVEELQSQMEEDSDTTDTVEPTAEPLQINDEVIQTDRLLEMVESGETPASELEKIRLIKAPKRELEGLKVVGKIELPKPVEKKAEVEEKVEIDERDLRKAGYGRRPKKQPLTEEEREKRRLKAKKRKEENEARQAKRKKAQEEQRKKERNQAYYKQKLEQTKPRKSTPKKGSTAKSAQKRKAPKTLLGKFWRWLNT